MTHPWSVELVRVGTAVPSMLRVLREDLVRTLAHAVWVADRSINPSPAFDPHRQQYNAITLLVMLNDPPPPPDVARIGVTDVDLFLPVFTHVFGEAQLQGTAAVVSCHRLRPQFGGDPLDQAVLRSRLLRETLHELGHVLGLTHCRVSWCAMAPSRLPEEVDLKDAAFCDRCSERIGVPLDGFRSMAVHEREE